MSAISYIEKVAAVSLAISKADREFEHSIRLTRLVDGEATYTATCTGSTETKEFAGHEEASEWVRGLRDLARAEAVLRQLGAFE